MTALQGVAYIAQQCPAVEARRKAPVSSREGWDCIGASKVLEGRSL